MAYRSPFPDPWDRLPVEQQRRPRWRAKLDFYAAAGVKLPPFSTINDEDWAAMQRPGPSPAEPAARPNAPTGQVRRRPGLFTPDVRPARPLLGDLDLSE